MHFPRNVDDLHSKLSGGGGDGGVGEGMPLVRTRWLTLTRSL